MFLLLETIGFLSVIAAFLTVIHKCIRIIKPTAPKSAKITNKNLGPEEYILRKKEYDTYQSIKYGAKIKSAAMSGSTLILIDLELIKAVNQKDFSSFADRHSPSYHSDPTMNKMLSFATGEEWKRLKTILTQAFSASQIRRVHASLDESGNKLVNYIRAQLRQADFLIK